MQKKKIIEGYLIDPYLGVITNRRLKQNSLDDFYKLMDCSCIDVVSCPNDLDIWVDDGGFDKERAIEEHGFFGGTRFHLPDSIPFDLWGKILLLKNDKQGRSITLPESEFKLIRPHIKMVRIPGELAHEI